MAAVAHTQGVDACNIEVWFADEARVGQKNKITRRWARRGTRPSAPQDQRTASTYIFGAICPAEGKAAGLVLPWCNTEAMGLHLAEISARVAPGRHAMLLVDQAGWHVSDRLAVPANITVVPLPAKCPELNPQENVWQFLRDNWLSNRVFTSYDNIVDHCCHAWNRLVDQPWTIMSIGQRNWAKRFLINERWYYAASNVPMPPALFKLLDKLAINMDLASDPEFSDLTEFRKAQATSA